MNVAPLLIICLPVLLVVCVGLVGSTRRIGFLWAVVLSLLFTPIVGWLIAYLSGPRRAKPAKKVTSPTLDGHRPQAVP